jgi:hypothetical protein
MAMVGKENTKKRKRKRKYEKDSDPLLILENDSPKLDRLAEFQMIFFLHC